MASKDKSAGQKAALREAHSFEVKGQKPMRKGPPEPPTPLAPNPAMKASAKADVRLKQDKVTAKTKITKGKNKK